MFRLKEQQLHIVIWLIAVSSLLLFGFFGLEHIPKVDESGLWKGMEDFSDGWICTYETTDMNQLKEYQKTKEVENENGDTTIVDVITFPAVLQTKKDTTISMLHQVPEMDLDTVYVTIQTEDAGVKVSVEEDIIYESSGKESMLPVCHIIPVAAKYKDKMMKIEVSGKGDNSVEIGALQTGNYNQLWVSVLKENVSTAVIGFLLVSTSICMLIVWLLVQNTWQQKRLLLYSGVEGLLMGMLCLLDSDLLTLITGWNYGIYMLKVCLVILAIILHLMIVRCFIYKKKVLAIVDTSILLVGVFFISVMVLQAFSLIFFDTIYTAGNVLYGVFVILFTIVLAITILDYKRKEGLPVFIANTLLILSMLMQIAMWLSGKQEITDYIYVRLGFLVYMIYIWVFGMRQAFYVKPKQEEMSLDEGQIREQIIDQINPNLLFASFHTLQNLIKSGSAKSVKMIYYISVYFRDNLKALETMDDSIPFEEELEHIIAYLQLQKTRNQSLDFTIECKVKEFNIPRHSLEPLVENAVKHGIAKNGNKGNVAVRTYQRADGYAIQIIDDGAGFDTNILKKHSLSLSKKMDILESVCGARTEIISKEGKGTVITIVLPMLDNDLMDEIEIIEG